MSVPRVVLVDCRVRDGRERWRLINAAVGIAFAGHADADARLRALAVAAPGAVGMLSQIQPVLSQPNGPVNRPPKGVHCESAPSRKHEAATEATSHCTSWS
jgi:hypothetical protein